MYRVKNTANDRSKTLLHRVAPGFVEEPTLGSRRIRLGEYLDITDEHYDRVKDMLAGWVKKGMVSVIKLVDSNAHIMEDLLSTPSVTPVVPVVDDSVEQIRLAAEIVKAKEMAAVTAEIVEELPTTPTDNLTMSTEPAGATVETSSQEESEQKRGPGRPKKKLF